MLKVTCTINGAAYETHVHPGTTLLEMVRELGFTGVKQGCGVGECGGCTLLVDGRAINSCIHLAVWADGAAIRTVEGEGREGALSPVQQAYVDENAIQCGFCTPGLVMRTTAYVEEMRAKGVTSNDLIDEDIRRAHAGNLCRCTGYDVIVRAVRVALAALDAPPITDETAD